MNKKERGYINKIITRIYGYIYEKTLESFEEGEFSYDYQEKISEELYDLQVELEAIAWAKAEEKVELYSYEELEA